MWKQHVVLVEQFYFLFKRSSAVWPCLIGKIIMELGTLSSSFCNSLLWCIPYDIYQRSSNQNWSGEFKIFFCNEPHWKHVVVQIKDRCVTRVKKRDLYGRCLSPTTCSMFRNDIWQFIATAGFDDLENGKSMPVSHRINHICSTPTKLLILTGYHIVFLSYRF